MVILRLRWSLWKCGTTVFDDLTHQMEQCETKNEVNIGQSLNNIPEKDCIRQMPQARIRVYYILIK